MFSNVSSSFSLKLSSLIASNSLAVSPKELSESMFGTTEGKTMEDYFTELNISLDIDKDTLKNDCKEKYPNETDWSF